MDRGQEQPQAIGLHQRALAYTMPMKRIVIVIIAVIALLLIALAAFFLLRPEQEPVAPGSPSFPSGGPAGQGGITGEMLVLPSRSGEPILVKDFLGNGITKQDSINPTHYYLAGKNALCELEPGCYTGAPADDYDIIYIADEEAFLIGLTQEPLGEARRRAEQFLLNALGVTQDELCALDYFLTTDEGVSEQYAGADLAFSFCPGAVALP